MDEFSGLRSATWKDLTEQQPPEAMNAVEKMFARGLDMPKASGALQYGIVSVGDFFAPALLDAYAADRERLTRDLNAKDNFWKGWHDPTPYLRCASMLDLATDPRLMALLETLTGEMMGLHLCLTGWVSTERAWHQDTYLNPDGLWSNYLAVWIPLEDVDPDSGPFEFVAGSHRWESIRRGKLFEFMTPEQRADPSWPSQTQAAVASICEREIHSRGAQVEQYLGQKGDVMVWHSNLMHRGSEPRNKTILRKALICHYSSIRHRTDMSGIVRNPRNGSLYFDFG